MAKIACLALLLAGIIGWSIKDDATSKPASVDPRKPAALLSPEQFAQRLRDNAPTRERLEKQYPDTWQQLAMQSRGKIQNCIVTELHPGMLRADCR